MPQRERRASSLAQSGLQGGINIKRRWCIVWTVGIRLLHLYQKLKPFPFSLSLLLPPLSLLSLSLSPLISLPPHTTPMFGTMRFNQARRTATYRDQRKDWRVCKVHLKWLIPTLVFALYRVRAAPTVGRVRIVVTILCCTTPHAQVLSSVTVLAVVTYRPVTPRTTFAHLPPQHITQRYFPPIFLPIVERRLVVGNHVSIL